MGVNGFISKPLFRSKLYNKLNELLGHEKAQSEQDDEAADIAGMRILIAEDNDVNWEIISTLLEMHDVETERAENGQLAVERMEKRLRENAYPYRVKAIVYPHAGHLLGTNPPASWKKAFPAEKKYPAECEAARKDCFEQEFQFLKEWQ